MLVALSFTSNRAVSPSSTVGSLSMNTWGGESSSSIVPSPVLSPNSAPVGLRSLTLNVSLPS